MQPISEQKRKRIIELKQEGLSHPVIADRLGVHKGTVQDVWNVFNGKLSKHEKTRKSRNKP